MEEYSAYVGLDVHKDTIAVAVAYPDREKAESRGIIPNSKRALMKLIHRLERNGERMDHLKKRKGRNRAPPPAQSVLLSL